VGHGEAGMTQLYPTHTQLDMMQSRVSAALSSRTKNAVARGAKRVLALVEGTKRKEPIMSVADCEIEETDQELCTEHMHYRPCRACKRQHDIERAEAMKDE
jgi:poly-beta-hydroxyalkanoate depolymerase